MEQKSYFPAAGRDWALPLYDPLVRLLGADNARAKLLEQAAIQHGERVLDVGCGTGTLATLIKRLHADVEVVGLDPDPKALARAERKAQRAGVSVQFDRGFADELPYPDASFDRVFSSFMFHHLPADQKKSTLRDIRRVLVPGGSLHMLDFRRSEGNSRGRLRDNSDNRILSLMHDAGFSSAKKVSDGAMLVGLLRIGYYDSAVSTANGHYVVRR